MKVLKEDLKNRSLANFLALHVLPVGTRIHNGAQKNVYDTSDIIRVLEQKIKQYAHAQDKQANITLWKRNLALVKDFVDEKA